MYKLIKKENNVWILSKINTQVNIYYKDKKICLRLFKNDGVELFDDDFKYIKENDILYISTGEKFDQESVINEFE